LHLLSHSTKHFSMPHKVLVVQILIPSECVIEQSYNLALLFITILMIYLLEVEQKKQCLTYENTINVCVVIQ